MATEPGSYAARLQIDYPERLDRVTTFFRLIWIIPIGIILALLLASGGGGTVTEAGETVRDSGGGIAAGLAIATALMIVFRQPYPRWWFVGGSISRVSWCASERGSLPTSRC